METMPALQADAIHQYYGSLMTSIFSLLMSVTGGIDWEDGYKPLYDVGVFAVVVYVVYILFASFCVMNVIIGIFCQNASEAFEQDRDKVNDD